MPIATILGVLGLGIGALDLSGVLHLPHGLGIAALALGAVVLILVFRIIGLLIRIIAGAVVLALAAGVIFGHDAFRHLF